ncbi:hypothetical protein C451_02739 [Halococcus thailandensis JCM 13552]|uniref:Uncharacterized protein n=1 Tax=Halococcus thailandensis JCM 13552 TaxID=1227457 RepID=M0NEF2_9EURY|nr:hypothetical protein C451_02739 [Halococcus thailandensis JCM 13552]
MVEHNSSREQTVDSEQSTAVVEVGPTRINEEGKMCPNCGGVMSYGVIVESGTEEQLTEYMGLSCSECSTQGVFCPDCESVHKPGYECPARIEREQDEVAERLGGVVGVDVGVSVGLGVVSWMPTARLRKPPERSTPAARCALRAQTVSAAVLTSPGFAERSGPFHSLPATAW